MILSMEQFEYSDKKTPDGFHDVLPEKLSPSEKPLGEVNTLGYAVLAQETFGGHGFDLNLHLKGKPLYTIHRSRSKDVLRWEIDITPAKTKELMLEMEVALKTMPQRVQQAVRLYYGLDQEYGVFMRVEEIAKKLENVNNGKSGVSAQRARQIINRAKRLLREPSRSMGLRNALGIKTSRRI
jgi:hypothetical protein